MKICEQDEWRDSASDLVINQIGDLQREISIQSWSLDWKRNATENRLDSIEKRYNVVVGM